MGLAPLNANDVTTRVDVVIAIEQRGGCHPASDNGRVPWWPFYQYVRHVKLEVGKHSANAIEPSPQRLFVMTSSTKSVIACKVMCQVRISDTGQDLVIVVILNGQECCADLLADNRFVNHWQSNLSLGRDLQRFPAALLLATVGIVAGCAAGHLVAGRLTAVRPV